MKTVLLLATTTGYQTRMFGEAAEKLGVRLVYATDRCDMIEDPWADGAIPIRFHLDDQVRHTLEATAADLTIDGVLAVGDRPTVAAAYAAELLGLPGNYPDAAKAARDKRLTRARLHAAGLPTPAVRVMSFESDPRKIAAVLPFPVVVKPSVLSGSRGVIRADSPREFVAAFRRVARLVASRDVRELRDPAAEDIIVESYVPGREFALEAVLERGRLHPLALFDKPDPLEGPFFEETIYVTPSRTSPETQDAIITATANGARAIGLSHGPIHAECRVNERGVYVLEIAARPIGGLCARALHFTGPQGREAGLEELLLRHALGESVANWRREDRASGVMMIPIPAAGVYRGVRGLDEARAVPHVWDIRITAKLDQQLVPIPEGASYLGFIFARAARPADVEGALRDAHARLDFVIDRSLPVLTT